MNKVSEQIKINLDGLDLEKIHRVMKFLGWTWEDSESKEKSVPTIDELRNMAEFCMDKAWKSDDKLCNLGGFEAEVIEGLISIKFILERSNPLAKLLG